MGEIRSIFAHPLSSTSAHIAKMRKYLRWGGGAGRGGRPRWISDGNWERRSQVSPYTVDKYSDKVDCQKTFLLLFFVIKSGEILYLQTVYFVYVKWWCSKYGRLPPSLHLSLSPPPLLNRISRMRESISFSCQTLKSPSNRFEMRKRKDEKIRRRFPLPLRGSGTKDNSLCKWKSPPFNLDFRDTSLNPPPPWALSFA